MRFFALFAALLVLAAPAAASSLLPVIANPGFEETAPGNDAPGWGWHCGAAASFRSDATNPHSGERCVVFTNQSETAPNVYARLYQVFGVLPGTQYELSVWVRGEDVQPGQHFTDWHSYTLNLPVATFGWQKVSCVFTTSADQRSLNLGINIANKCRSLAIDDISLRPIGAPLKGDGISGSYLIPGRIDGDNRASSLAVYITSSLGSPGTLEAVIRAGGELLFEKRGPVEEGDSEILWQWNSGSAMTRELNLSLRVLDADGNVVVSAQKRIEKLTPAIILADIDQAEARLNSEFATLYRQCRARGIPLDYPNVAKTTLDQFIPLARADAAGGEERRADFSVSDFNRSLDEAIGWMRACLKDPTLAPNAVRYQTGAVEIDGLSFVGNRKDSRGDTSRGPLFFCGYGHFSQIRYDMHRWPGYGVNIIQSSEFGPSAVFPAEDEVSLTPVETLISALDDAAKHNVKVDFLLSPHYFPHWAMEKWPHLGWGGGGFLGFCVDAPEAKQVVEKFIRLVVPMIKDKPALHSICLTNEPVFDRAAGCGNTAELWAAYLAREHGSVEETNKRFGSSYGSFAEVPMFGGGAYDAPQFYDYCRFNRQRFAGWHKWMADVIHEIAPDVPVHAKLCMVLELPVRQNSTWGVDAELFAELSEINGNDCYFMPGEGEWGASWHLQNMVYDLQRSFAKKPIFNSENHLQHDGSSSYIAPEHYRTALWQGAIHGQGATTIWVWERSVREHVWSHPFYGNVMDRPGCAEAVGVTCLDLNRFAEEVTALQNAEAPVAILYSLASFVKSPGFVDAMNRAYAALNFCGVKIDFISEKQLAEGKGAGYRMIILPQATHLPEDSMRALCSLSGAVRLVVLGEGPSKDPYGQELPGEQVSRVGQGALVLAADADPEKVLWSRLSDELGRLGALPELSVVDASTGRPVWGVEWLPARVDGRTVVNIVNLLAKPVDVKVLSQGRAVQARDLLSLGGREPVGRLKPITPVLAEVSLIR